MTAESSRKVCCKEELVDHSETKSGNSQWSSYMFTGRSTWSPRFTTTAANVIERAFNVAEAPSCSSRSVVRSRLFHLSWQRSRRCRGIRQHGLARRALCDFTARRAPRLMRVSCAFRHWLKTTPTCTFAVGVFLYRELF